MKSRTWLTLVVVLLGAVGGVCAQPYGYGPGPGPYGGAPGMPPMPMQPGPFGAPGQAPQAQAPAQASAQAPAQVPAQVQAPAKTQAGAAPAAQNPMVEAATTIKAGMEKLTGFLSQKEIPNKLQTAAFLDREIAPYFDFAYMAKWVAGASYARMSDEDKKALSARLEASFLSALGGHLANYSGQQVKVLRPRPIGRGALSVPVGVVKPGAYPARMEFRMYRSKDGWKVYDVLANGRSAASFYRVQFQRMGSQGAAGQSPETTGPGQAPAQVPAAPGVQPRR